jgi:hypothetical protein
MTHQRHDEELRAEESHEENVRAIRLPARRAAVPKSREDIELCLAHRPGNAVSRSYNHATAIEKRRAIMQWWGDFLTDRT